jgi:molybdenum cofactor biosynthesis enzyme MoaA
MTTTNENPFIAAHLAGHADDMDALSTAAIASHNTSAFAGACNMHRLMTRRDIHAYMYGKYFAASWADSDGSGPGLEQNELDALREHAWAYRGHRCEEAVKALEQATTAYEARNV